MREKIKTFVVYNDGVETESHEDDKGNWCPKKEVRKLEADYTAMTEAYKNACKERLEIKNKLDITIKALGKLENRDFTDNLNARVIANQALKEVKS